MVSIRERDRLRRRDREARQSHQNERDEEDREVEAALHSRLAERDMNALTLGRPRVFQGRP